MSKFQSLLFKYVSGLLFVFLPGIPQSTALAQISSANLTVSTVDTTGAMVSGVNVIIRNVETNQEQRSLSGKTGNASFSFLKPGHYALTISKDKFADVTVENLVLNVGDEKHLQLVLKIGPATQTVNVDGSGATINTTDASVSTVIDRRFVANMPLNGRSFQDLISMTPGIVTASPQSGSPGTAGQIGSSGDFSVNGQRTESNYYTVDGVSANVGAGNGYGRRARAECPRVPHLAQRKAWRPSTNSRNFASRARPIRQNTDMDLEASLSYLLGLERMRFTEPRSITCATTSSTLTTGSMTTMGSQSPLSGKMISEARLVVRYGFQDFMTAGEEHFSLCLMRVCESHNLKRRLFNMFQILSCGSRRLPRSNRY